MSLTLNLATPSVSERLVLIIQSLCRAIAARGGRDRTNTALIVLAWSRVQRMATRFAAIVQAGRPPAKPRDVPRTRPSRPAPAIQANRLPRGFAWMVRLVPESAVCGTQLQFLLTDPQMTELLKATPQAGRILRPLCRMLGISPGPATLPPPPQADPTEPPTPAEPSPDEPRLLDHSADPDTPRKRALAQHPRHTHPPPANP